MMKKLLTITACCWAASLMAAANPIMLILAPHDLADSWRWYAAQRQKNHPEVDIRVQDTDEIYKQFEYKDIRCPSTGPRPSNEVGPNDCRYPSESIYRWLQNYYTQNPTLKYLVLGGAWLDVTDSVVHYHQDGTEINLGNAIPSMRVWPNNKGTGFYNATDAYYACLKNQNETGHHWDPNNDGLYLIGNHGSGGEEESTRGYPDISVTRMTMKPIVMDASVEFNPEFELVGGKRILNQHQLITNFLYKVNRAEGKGIVGRHWGKDAGKDVIVDEYAENMSRPFDGKNKLAITSTYLQSKNCGLNDPKVLRDENEFFDGAPNMYAPEYPLTWEDTGPHMRRHASEVTAFYRPVVETVSYHANNIYSKNAVGSAFSGAFNTYDREIGAVNGHGWAGGTGWFSAKTFSTCSGLTKVNVVGISCETGFLDIYGNQNGKSVANLSLGESGMANVTKTGGVIASINNSRYGWVNWEVEQLFGQNQSWRMHYLMYYGLNKGMNAGDAWLFMMQKYWEAFAFEKSGFGKHLPPSIPGQCYTQMMLFGDPLIAVVPNETDLVYNENTSKTVDFPAVNGAPQGTMSLMISQPSDATFTMTGNGGLKVMRGITVSGGTLAINTNGGQGGVGTYKEDASTLKPDEKANAQRPNGLVFTNPGELVFGNTSPNAYTFVNKISKAKKITFAGGGAIINTDKFDETLPNDGLVFNGQNDFEGKAAPANVIRANLNKEKGAFARFLPLNLNNTSLQFETYEAFEGYKGDTFANLVNSKLSFRVNRWRGLTDRDYSETVRGTLSLNDSILAADYPASIYLDSPTVNVLGTSSLQTTHGGAFKLKGEMKINLEADATLTIDAEIQPVGNASMTIIGSGRVIVKNPKGLVGDVRLDEGLTLELTQIPLANAARLTLAPRTHLVLPSNGNFYQILPLSSALFIEDASTTTVALKNAEGEESEIKAEITQTGSVFISGSISAWTKSSGTWDGTVQYFPDVIVNHMAVNATVDVAKNVVSSFACFANSHTAYTFRSVASAAISVTFDSLSIVGKTRFDLPTVFKTRLYVSGGEFVGDAVKTPLIEVAANGSLEAKEISPIAENGAATTVRVQSGSSFVLAGEHAMSLMPEAGAKFKAENGKYLAWNPNTSVVWPNDGVVMVEVDGFEVTDELKPIIKGVNADMAFLRHLQTTRDDVSLAIDAQGNVCLVRCDADHPNWLAIGERTVESSSAIVFDQPERFATLTFKGKEESTTLDLTIGANGSLLTDEVHFEKIVKANLTNLKLGTGTLFAAEETHIFGDSFGVLSMTANDTVYLHTPTSPWALASSAKGTVYVGITDVVRAERQKIFKVGADVEWPIAGFTAMPYDFKAEKVRDDFIFVRDGEWVYLVPPAIKGTVSGSATWSQLNWIAYDNKEVKIENWHNVAEVEIVSENDSAVVVMNGAPTMKLVTSGNKLTLKAGEDSTVKLPSEVVFNNELTIEGPILSALDYVKSENTAKGKLILNTGDVTEIVIPGNIMPIEAEVEIVKGSTLRLAHQTYFQNKAANFTFISGCGTLEIKDVSPKGARFFMPENALMFSKDLTFKLQTELELQRCHCSDRSPLVVGNLTGSGKWGYGLMDPNTMLREMGYFMNNNTGGMLFDKWKELNCGTRVLKTIQSAVSEWSGWLPDWYGVTGFGIRFDAGLVVAGTGTEPSIEKRLIYSGKAADNASLSCTGDKGADHDVTIDRTGCFELNGYWNGNIRNDGILVIGQKCVIKNDKTKFSGSGKIATLGGQINLISYSDLKRYKLTADTYGEIFFTAAQDFGIEQQIMSAEEYVPKEELILVAEKDGVRQWQRATAANFKDGKLMWLGEGGKETESNIELEIEGAKKGFFDLITDDKYLGGATSVTLSGVSTEASVLDATSDLGQYKGIVNLSNVTVKSVSPIETKLGKNPVGKLIFVVDDPEHESELMGLETGFTYDPTQFSVEIVDKAGKQVETYWTWTVQNGAIKYVLTDPKSNLYMSRAFKFDGDLSSWGTNGQNLGTINADKFVRSRGGNALTGHNQHGDGFEIGGKDWTVSWSARLSPTSNAVHFALGTKSGGGFTLTTVSENRVAISRWLGNQAAIKLIEADVPFATKRFNSYILTYRNGYYTLYVNGEKVGETKKDVDGATKYPNSINWQFFSIHGGNVGATDYGTAGAIDDWRLYTVALGDKMIKTIAAEFSPWPEFGKPDENGEIWIDVDEMDGQIFVEGTGTYHLTSKTADTSVARFVSLSGTAKIIIEAGVELVVDMSGTNRNPLLGHAVEVRKGARLVLRQTSDMVDNGTTLAGQNLSKITGQGTIEFRSDDQRYTLQFPSSRKVFEGSTAIANTYWSDELSVCINTKVRLTSTYQTAPLVFRNLSGSGSFLHFGGNELNLVEIRQNDRSVFTGTFPAEARVTIVGDADATEPNPETPLVWKPTGTVGACEVTISENAALALANSDNVRNVKIINNGMLVFEPAANETVDVSALKFGGESLLQQIAMTGEGTVILPIGNAIFMLASNPTGTLKIPAGSNVVEGQYIMTLAPGATIDPTVFKLVIADSQRTAIPYADGNELKFRFRVSPPKILFR